MKTTDYTADMERLCHLAGLAPRKDDICRLACDLDILITSSQKLVAADLPDACPCADERFCPLREDLPEENADSTLCEGGVFAVKRIIT